MLKSRSGACGAPRRCVSDDVRAAGGAADSLRLKYVVIISRHGVRSPTWSAERLNQDSTEPWPGWGVPPGNLTARGAALMKLMGGYYLDWLSSERLLAPRACKGIYVWADTDQRTLETGRVLADAVSPGCETPVHSLATGQTDPLFDPIATGMAKADTELAAKAVRDRLSVGTLAESHRAAFLELQDVLVPAGSRPPARTIEPPAAIAVTTKEASIELTEPLATASTLTENFLLEYTNGMQAERLGWGRLNADSLSRLLALHATYADSMRRTPYLARVRGSNLVAHVLQSLAQAVTGTARAEALGQPGDSVLILSGHDTNLSNVSGTPGCRGTCRDTSRTTPATRRARVLALARRRGRTGRRPDAICRADSGRDARSGGADDGRAAGRTGCPDLRLRERRLSHRLSGGRRSNGLCGTRSIRASHR